MQTLDAAPLRGKRLRLTAGKRAATAVKVFPADKELVSLQKSVKDGYELQLAAAIGNRFELDVPMLVARV